MSHPVLQTGWIDRPHLSLSLGDFQTEMGGCIKDAFVSYVVHGDLQSGLPVVLCPSAIASTHHRLDFLIGKGMGLDQAHCTVIAVDALGNGLSISPSNSQVQPGEKFPFINLRDMVKSQSLLLDFLGVSQVHAVVGASMGGMQALQWAVSEPKRIQNVIAMTPMARSTTWARLMNETSRRVLQAHPGWRENDPQAWSAWVPLMQMINSRTPEHWDAQYHELSELLNDICSRVEAWQQQRYSVFDWICQTHAYDAHDVGSTPGHYSTESALASIRAQTLIMAPPLDLYNPAGSAKWAAKHIPNCRFIEIPSQWGHQSATFADTNSVKFLNQSIYAFLWGNTSI
jgi:homoserine O-acetyltransferase